MPLLRLRRFAPRQMVYLLYNTLFARKNSYQIIIRSVARICNVCRNKNERDVLQNWNGRRNVPIISAAFKGLNI